MKANDTLEFNSMRNVIYGVTFICVLFLGYIEYHTVRSSMLQTMLEEEYAYDYACSQSRAIVKKAEYSRNAYVSNTIWFICEGDIEDEGNFVRPLDVEKSSPNSNTYDYGGDMAHERVLSVLLNSKKNRNSL